jgi:hypothetical protein
VERLWAALLHNSVAPLVRTELEARAEKRIETYQTGFIGTLVGCGPRTMQDHSPREKRVHYLSTLAKDKDVVSELPKVNGPLPKVNGPLAELIKTNEEKWQKSNAQSQEIYEAVAQGLPNADILRAAVAGYKGF